MRSVGFRWGVVYHATVNDLSPEAPKKKYDKPERVEGLNQWLMVQFVPDRYF